MISDDDSTPLFPSVMVCQYTSTVAPWKVPPPPPPPGLPFWTVPRPSTLMPLAAITRRSARSIDAAFAALSSCGSWREPEPRAPTASAWVTHSASAVAVPAIGRAEADVAGTRMPARPSASAAAAVRERERMGVVLRVWARAPPARLPED